MTSNAFKPAVLKIEWYLSKPNYPVLFFNHNTLRWIFNHLQLQLIYNRILWHPNPCSLQ